MCFVCLVHCECPVLSQFYTYICVENAINKKKICKKKKKKKKKEPQLPNAWVPNCRSKCGVWTTMSKHDIAETLLL